MSGLRIVMVGHCHPDMPHVCAMRMRCFAGAMAGRGHRVVLLSESLAGDGPAPDPERVSRDLEGHDWTVPYRLGCPPRRAPLLEGVRRGGHAINFRFGSLPDVQRSLPRCLLSGA